MRVEQILGLQYCTYCCKAEEDFSEAEIYPAWRVPLMFEGSMVFGGRDEETTQGMLTYCLLICGTPLLLTYKRHGISCFE